MALGALEVEKSSALGPGSGFKADQSAGDESRVIRLVFSNFTREAARAQERAPIHLECTQYPRERPQYTDPQPCIAIRLAFTLFCCLSSLLHAGGPSVRLIAAIVPLNQEMHDVETEARSRCPYQSDVLVEVVRDHKPSAESIWRSRFCE
ncbi:hypothetical protein FIBSPDRAFT_880187 [Athelia psychrophila]|uniref:Uncharacterized protein n=1 Tax=Athelia psychrophila TaxID=1759441 RepID=A0A167T6A4_9AGAM|nr:hypothetical protein FIBSPDRAFT_880187 [Fibularhizoctonia sp. CBS 109695]